VELISLKSIQPFGGGKKVDLSITRVNEECREIFKFYRPVTELMRATR